MANLKFFDDHNKLAFLEKGRKSEGFNEIVDFLKESHISYALLVNPTIYVEHMRQFWTNAQVHDQNDEKTIVSRICDREITISESKIRTHLHLNDARGITSIEPAELYSELLRMGYEGPTSGFTFYKSQFSPQWRFFVHTLIQAFSRKTPELSTSQKPF